MGRSQNHIVVGAALLVVTAVGTGMLVFYVVDLFGTLDVPACVPDCVCSILSMVRLYQVLGFRAKMRQCDKPVLALSSKYIPEVAKIARVGHPTPAFAISSTTVQVMGQCMAIYLLNICSAVESQALFASSRPQETQTNRGSEFRQR